MKERYGHLPTIPAFSLLPSDSLTHLGRGEESPYLFSLSHIFYSCHLRNVLTARPLLGDLRKGGSQGFGGPWVFVDLMEVSGLTQATSHRQHPGHPRGLGGSNGAAMSLTTYPAWG